MFSEEHRQMQETLKRFIDNEINPNVDEWEKAGIFPAHEVFGKLGKLGLLGVTKPSRFGGLDLDYSYSVAVAEALGHIHCGGIPMAIGVQTDMATPALARFGSDELREQFLAPSISGEFVACLGVSETGAGSDVASIGTTARRDGDDYIIRGGKMWTTNGTQADWICLLANTSEGSAHRNKSLICVPMNTTGVQITKKLNKAGMHSSDTAQLFFDDVRVPQRYRIGEEGMGFIYQMQQFQEERLWAAAGWTKGERILNETIKYLGEREAFGQPLLNNQFIYFKLAELRTELEAVRSLLYRATTLYVAGEDVSQLASMA
ncbi:MAG: acyl-CoA dehydrogenase family protein, partial [Burkholderiaceae bacterium]